ncbi:MAG: GxxExxY protein [Bacteroidetes bacterium]|nr:GxxExxY protein [Bacteroidota bacterium]
MVKEPNESYGLNDLLYKDEVYSIISCCFEVHKILGKGFLEAVYSDFIVFDKIRIEVKAQQNIIDKNLKQTINYLAASKMKLGLIVNFGEESLKFKRVIL